MTQVTPESTREERILHQRVEWFSKKYAPADKYENAEWHADLLMLVQAVHSDASRETHALLTHALRAMPMTPSVFYPASGSGGSSKP